ncbi:NAD(P)-dependent oxidoreductase (plasmid) [Deinococcus sp. KNUC1210]|nr:NAD(P)-dependent oxidoreductase [Deinococcus sp. KNUC1210]ULH14316.1 NAD(P)-dependent oxidoreductase [Deinococcus sp. KNUC1210]
MGRPMAKRLLAAGVQVTVFNRSPEPLRELGALGAAVATSTAEAVQGASVVVTMLPNGPVVTDVLEAILGALAPGTLLIDMSSIHPAAAQRHAALLASRGCQCLDAPVSGGTVGAEAGTLAIMVGGEAADLARAEPLLRLLGNPVHVGPSGSGQLCKLVNQAIVAVTIGAVAEGLSLARAGGADPVKVREAIMGGFCQSRILELHGARMNERRFEPGGTVTNQVKDLVAVLDVANSNDLQLPLTAQVHELFADMLKHGDGNLDHSALITQIERISGVQNG